MAITYAIAAPGYGKRSAPSQHPSGPDDFAHLTDREAEIAGYIDGVPDGAAIDVKSLARMLARFGQQAVSTVLRALTRKGHLRRVRERVGEGLTQWVSRTYFSRTPRSSAWWEQFLTDRRTGGRTDPAPAPPARSVSYRALASLAAADRRMMLSAAECAELEALAAEWFARGVTVEQFRFAMTNGLPATVQCPGAFARKRLLDRLPPEQVIEQAPSRLTECQGCYRPARPNALQDGRCRRCREEHDRSRTPGLIAGIRAAMRERGRPGGVSDPAGSPPPPGAPPPPPAGPSAERSRQVRAR
ncbi:hypothetical protein ABH937_001362 [Kitasatospora sp. GAS1066B]